LEAPEASPLQTTPVVEAAVSSRRPVNLIEATGYDTDQEEDQEDLGAVK